VYFSATLLPIDYYKDLLCTERDVYAIYVNSVFEQKNRLLVLGTDVTSKYTRRGEDEYLKFVKYIDTIVSAKQGNYMVFGPSYKFLEEVYSRYLMTENVHVDSEYYDNNKANNNRSFNNENSYSNNQAENHNLVIKSKDIDIIIQRQNMTEQEREDFLNEFEKTRDKSLVAFCTLGGIFSEGIDLVGGKLIGSIILGAGLPQVGNERKLMSDFFDDNGKNGFEYAYLYPGMNKVIQAAGRVIRTKEDFGVIALLDERFRFSSYRKTFPREWNDACFTTVDDISLKLTNFWEKKN